VGLAAVGGLIGVSGTLGATWLTHTLRRRDELAAERREWVARGAAILGPLDSLLVDADPDRVRMNLGPESAELLKAMRGDRWERALRDELATLATAHPAAEIRDHADKLGVAVANSLITTSWLVRDMLANRDSSEFQRAKEDHAEAKRLRVELAEALRTWATSGQHKRPKPDVIPAAENADDPA